MSNIDIFAEGTSLQETWAKWETIGDAVQGTYVGFVNTKDPRGNDQIAYHLRQPDGSIISVGVKTTKKKFISLMEQIQKGQIIGIKYTKTLPPRNATESPTKILEIFQNQSIRDEQWLKDQSTLSSMKNEDGYDEDSEPAAPVVKTAQVAAPSDEPFPSNPLTDEQKLSLISEFAKAKLGAVDATQVRDKVMEFTGLAFITANLDQILTKLRSA